LVVALTVVFGVVVFSVEPSKSLEKVMMGTPSHGLFEFPVVVAMRRGDFNEEGLDVRKVQIQPAIGVRALLSGAPLSEVLDS
jgi:hypothetical protein